MSAGSIGLMTTLTELYARVRAQTETESSELSDARVNDFLEEAFNRTIAAEVQWPFYESSWTLTQAIGDTTLAISSEVSQPGIVSLYDLTDNRRINMIDHGTAEDWYSGVSGALVGRPVHYSLWEGVIQLWPAYEFAAERDYLLRGFRNPVAWSTIGPGDEPDCDSRLHLALSHYAISLAYAQQEDETLESSYMMRWQRDVEMARQNIMQPTQHRPVQMGPHYIGPIGSPSYTIDTP